MIEPKLFKRLGKMTISANGLRKIANYLQKRFKTEGNVIVEGSVQSWKENGKTKKTFGIDIK
jgi:hypothetical protein